MDGSSRPRAPQPAPPDRAFSFTDWQTNNPTAPPPGDKIDAELDRTNQAVEDVIEWVSTSLNSDGSLVEPPGTDPPPDDAAGPAEDWAAVSQAWAEHMPDTIPPNILAEMAITGEHWSARWWAKQAAQVVAGALSGAAVVGDTPPASPQQGQLWFDSVDAQLYVWYVDPTSAAWVIANADGGGPSASTVDVVNVRDHGAVGDGGTDDTAAISDAATAVNATGGTLYFPPGHYLVSAATPLASNVTVTGAGGASVLVVVYNFADPGGWTGNCVFSNKNGGATSLTDQNIVIENLAFDASALGSTGAQAGAFHHIRMRMAKGVIVRGCSFAYGGDAVACRACANVQVINNTARSFTNCAWDFWEACTNVQVIGNYAESAKSNQFLNFNSIDQSTDVNMHADDCVVSGNVFNCTGTGSAVLVEPLGTSSTNSVKNVVVSGNVFKRVELACRGNVDGLMISGNTFSDYTGNVSAIFCYPFYGGTPGSVQVCGNNFNNIHITNAFGVIRVEANSVVIVGNFIDGMGPSDGPCIYTGTCTGAVVSGNYLSNGGVVAPQSVTSSHNIFASHGKTFGTYDSAGKPLELTCQSDDNLVWWGTNSVGGQRLIMDMYQRSDTSLLFLGPEVAIATNEGNHVRVQGAAAGAAPGNSPIIYPFGADTNIPLRIGGHGNSGALLAVSTSGVPPTTSDISNNFLGIWHNTTDGSVKLYANIAGIMKSVALT